MQKVICTIRRKLVLSILLIALAALGVFVFAACSDDITEETYRQRGFTVAVTYNYQGGTVNNKESVRILVKENSALPTPKVGSGDISVPSKEGYSFKGFYVAETDENGKIVYDEDGNISVTDKAWDFNTDRVEDKDITLCAQWWDNYKVVLHYGDDYALKTEVSLPRNEDGSPTVMATAILVPDVTIWAYNLVKGSTDAKTAIDFPYNFAAVVPEGDGLEIDVWGKSLDGNYIVVRAAKDLNITDIGENTNYYLLNDIDMAGAKYDDETAARDNKIPKTYSGKFIGNGHTISNFTINMKALDRSYDSFGLFRTLADGAEVSNVTFKDVKLSCDISDTSINNYYLGMLAGQASSGALINNVNFMSGTFEYLIGVGVDNNKLNIASDLLIAQKHESVKLQGCTATNVKRIGSASVLTDDEEYMLYVKYEEGQDSIVLGEGDLYALAQKSNSGSYSSKRITKSEFVGDNKYILTRADRSVYDVTFTVSNGKLSATMVKR